ncbi:MAG: AI-2E family transporter [Alphaproteobacteria bacterium]
MTDDSAAMSLLVRRVFALLIILALAGVSLWLIKPFLSAMMWGAIIAISLYPVQRYLSSWLGGRRVIPAILLALLMVGVLLVPLVMLLMTVGEQASHLFQTSPKIDQIMLPVPPAWLAEIPLFGKRAFQVWQEAVADVPGTIEAARPKIRAALVWFLSGTVSSTLIVLEALVAIALAATFLVAAERLHLFFARLLRTLGSPEAAGVQDLVVRTVRGVAQGIIGTAIIQAAVAWIGFEIAPAPFPVLLTLLVFIACTAQLGALLVGLPAAGWIWYQGEPGWAAFLLGWTIFVNVIDNFIKPLLIGRGLPVPIWVVFIGVIGGLLAMGLVGLFIGPVVLAVSYLLMIRWIDHAA